LEAAKGELAGWVVAMVTLGKLCYLFWWVRRKLVSNHFKWLKQLKKDLNF